MVMQKLMFSSYNIVLLAIFPWVLVSVLQGLMRHAIADEKTQGNQFLSTSAQASPAVLTERTDNGSIQNRPATDNGIFAIGGYGSFYICLCWSLTIHFGSLFVFLVMARIWFSVTCALILFMHKIM